VGVGANAQPLSTEFFAFESGGQLCQDKLRTKQQKEASSLC
jgi:hypothetical protein